MTRDAKATADSMSDMEMQHQAHMVDIELTSPLFDLQRRSAGNITASRVWALVRLSGEPLGLHIFDIPPDGLNARAIETLVFDNYRNRLSEILRVKEEELPNSLEAVAANFDCTSFIRAHAEFISRAPKCSVVVCTRNRPQGARKCLQSLASQDHPNFAVWVVDNAPTNKDTQAVVQSFASDLDLHYVAEPCPGLSRARNAALSEPLEGEVVAWLDDDEIADSMWLSELVRAFDRRSDMVAASGAVIPAELQTPAQVWFEQFGGHSKGRGFIADEFSPYTWKRQHPLYPLPPFGVGANMAFRVEDLRLAGGFDVALGAGTFARGSEDTKVFTDLMLAGGTVAYRPSALTRHFHRRELEGLRRQMRGYGSGLTAFYTASVLARPTRALDLIRLAPRALRDLYSPDSLRVATLGDDFPRELLAENRRGLAAGPWLYLRGRIQNRRADHRRW